MAVSNLECVLADISGLFCRSMVLVSPPIHMAVSENENPLRFVDLEELLVGFSLE